MTDQRGPFWEREAFPAGARVVRPGLFESMLEPLVNVLSASDAVLSPVQNRIATVDETGLEAGFQSTIGVAEQQLSDQRAGADDQTAIELVDAGAGADRLRIAVAKYLPGLDAEIRVDFTDPPVPPGATGETGEGGGPPQV